MMVEPNPVGADALDAFQTRLIDWWGTPDTIHPDGPELVYPGMEKRSYEFASGFAWAVASLGEVLTDARYEVRSGKGIDDEE